MRLCKACGTPEHGMDRCEVARRKREAASNTTSNAVAPEVVENTKVVAAMREEPRPKKQGWDRGKYNEYQRELMRGRRAAAKKVAA